MGTGPVGQAAMGVLATAIAAVAGAASAVAVEEVDLELVLAADASGSIDQGEIRLQREGYAAAITSGEILDAIGVGYLGRIAVTYVEWGDQGSQEVVVPWTVVNGSASAAAFADRLLDTPRLAFGRNAIGSVIDFSQRQIESNSFDGERLVIDVSADSAYSWGGVPLALARDRAIAAGITINGLAVLCRECSGRPMGGDLEGEFARRIIGGPASFVVTADGDTSFEDAVRKKLLLEIAGTDGPPRQPLSVGPHVPDRLAQALPDDHHARAPGRVISSQPSSRAASMNARDCSRHRLPWVSGSWATPMLSEKAALGDFDHALHELDSTTPSPLSQR